MSGYLSTKRQSNLEIRTHLRLLPRRVAKPKELQHLLRKHSQLRQWAIQLENEHVKEPLLNKLMKENYDTLKLSHKYYSEKRRVKFDKMTRSLRDKESNFIKKLKSEQQRSTKDKKEEEPSLLSRLFATIKSCFCYNC